MKTIAILGTGSSALFSIMACNDRGLAPSVFGKQSSFPAGAFYYHWLPAYYERWLPMYPINYTYIGTEEGYIQKQWGNVKCETSFGKYDFEKGFNPAEVLDLFKELGIYELISDRELLTGDIFNLCEEYKAVICTFPLAETEITIKPIQRPVTIEIPKNPENNRITYCGSYEFPWVRQSILFGKKYTEYAKIEHVPDDMHHVKIADIHPDAVAQFPLIPTNLHFIGRYAEYNRKRLAHEAYSMTEEILDAI